MKTNTKREKKEYRYQFLGYDEIGTGKYTASPLYGLGLALENTVMTGSKVKHNMVEIKKTIAMIFDKQLGIVKQTEIQKL